MTGRKRAGSLQGLGHGFGIPRSFLDEPLLPLSLPGCGLEKEICATSDKGWHEVEFQGLGQRWTKQEAEWVLYIRKAEPRLITLHAL